MAGRVQIVALAAVRKPAFNHRVGILAEEVPFAGDLLPALCRRVIRFEVVALALVALPSFRSCVG